MRKRILPSFNSFFFLTICFFRLQLIIFFFISFSLFQVRMGFGLHAGWAIEGAVGSLQKVDATYLSPHVNMAARLETSSKQYGVPLLASQVRLMFLLLFNGSIFNSFLWQW